MKYPNKARRQEIYSFYNEFYHLRQIQIEKFNVFEKRGKALGFSQELSDDFMEDFPFILDSSYELEEVLNRLWDPESLSKLTYQKVLCSDGSIDDADWYYMARERIKDLTSPLIQTPFFGTPKIVTLSCVALEEDNSVFKNFQNLALFNNGLLWIQRQRYPLDFSQPLQEIKQLSVEEIVPVFDVFSECFSHPIVRRQAGRSYWALDMINTDNVSFSWEGNFYSDPPYHHMSASEEIRRILGIDDLFLFDGKSKDRLESIVR